MSAVRGVISELVERRLWPIAVLLVAAAIAIPVLLVKPASHAPGPTAVSGAGGSAPTSPAVNIAESAGGPVVGGRKDPFRQQHLAKASTTTSGATSTLGPATSSGGSSVTSGAGTSSGGGSSSGSGGSTGSSPAPPPPSSGPVTVLEVRFGRADGHPTTREITAGSPLPSSTNALLIYLGQTRHGAAFLVSSDAQPQGDGQCEPDKAICSTLYMKSGETEFFDVTGPTGTVQYQLDVVRVSTKG